MKKLLAIFLAVLMAVSCFAVCASAVDFSTVTISDVSLYGDDSIQNLKVYFHLDWDNYGDAYGKIAVHSSSAAGSEYDYMNPYKWDGSSWEGMDSPTGIDFVAWGAGEEFLWTDYDNPPTVSVSFDKGTIKKGDGKTYYVYLWTRSEDWGVYPDALLATVEFLADGIKITSATGSSETLDYHTHTNTLVSEKVDATTTSEGKEAVYKCTSCGLTTGGEVIPKKAGHTHCLCVGLDGEEAAHNEAQVWTEWTSTTSLPSTAGYYYLENDVVLSAKWMPAKGTKLCLNGHAIIGNIKDSQSNNNSAIIDDRWTDLELSDCNGSDSVHYFTVSSSGLYVLDTDGDYDGDEVVSGGIITGAKNNIAFWDSSGNYSYTVPGTSIKVGRYMTNASAGPNVGAGGAIHLREATLNMYGGTIVGNSAGQGGAFSGKSGSATFKGVKFLGNYSISNGGCIYAWGTNITIDGCEFSYNTTAGSSSVYQSRESTVLTMKNSSIHDNSAKSWVIASNQFTLANTEITENNSTSTTDPKWAGVYADAATITSSKISNNGGNGLRTGDATITDTEVLGNDGVNYTVSAGKVATISNSDIGSVSLWNSTSNNVTTRGLINYKETDEAGKVYSLVESPLTSGQFTVATADKESQLDRYDSFASDDDSVFVQLMDTGVEATRYSLMLIESYTINYDANGAEGTMESQVIDSAPAKDATLTELAFTKAGFVFMGWNTKADGTGLSYTDKELLRKIAITADAEITLYAQWENLCEEGHTVATDEAVPATCTATGLTEGSHCSVCGIIITAQEETEIIDHSFTDYVSNGDATCTEDGTKTAKCDNCDATDTVADEGSATGHSFTDYVSNDDATCKEDGTKTAKCDNCDATDTVADEGTATGHSFTDYVSNDDATCTEDGTKTAKCDNCDATDTVADEGTATGHSFTDYVSNDDATCLEDGTKTAKCDNCDATDTVADEGTATGHSFTDYVSNDDATCLEDGTKTAKCDNCDAEDTVTDDGSATGHDYVEQTDGSKICANCGDEIAAPENTCQICKLANSTKNPMWRLIYRIFDIFFHNVKFVGC